MDVSNPSQEQVQLAKVFISEKPIYAEMLMEKILTKVETTAELHSFGRIASMCMKMGIEKEQMQAYIAESFSGYWDEVESGQEG